VDCLILGSLLGAALFYIGYSIAKCFKPQCVEDVSISGGSALIMRYMKIYDDQSLSLIDKDAQMTKIINKMRAHSNSVKIVVNNLPVDLPINISNIDSKCKNY